MQVQAASSLLCSLRLNRRSAFSWSEPVASIQPEKPTFSLGPAQQKGGRKSNGRVAPSAERIPLSRIRTLAFFGAAERGAEARLWAGGLAGGPVFCTPFPAAVRGAWNGRGLQCPPRSHGGESRFICSRPLRLPGGIADVRVGLRLLAPRSPSACPPGMEILSRRPPIALPPPRLSSPPSFLLLFSARAIAICAAADDRVCYKPNECGLLSRTAINNRPNWSAFGCESLTDNILIGGDACQHGLSARELAGLPGPACRAGGCPARISC